MRARVWDCSRSLRKVVFRLLLWPLKQPVVACISPGYHMRLDLLMKNQRSIFYAREEYEPALQWAMQNFLPFGGTMVDCGANVGLFGLLAIAWRGARVFFLEPHPDLAAEIRYHLELNRCNGNGSVWEWAASDVEGPADLYEAPRHQFGGHTIVAEKKVQWGSRVITVERRRLDKLLIETGKDRIDFLKVDCEWHDLEVLRGAGDWLNPERIALVYAEMAGGQFEPVSELMTRCGYKPFYTHKPGLRKLRYADYWLDPKGFLMKPPRSSKRFRDVLWVGSQDPRCGWLEERLGNSEA
jgi:FkbM family methyltransferase